MGETKLASMNYLNIISYRDLLNWSAAHLLGNGLCFTKRYPFVRIGALLKPNRNIISVEDNVVYKQVTLRTNGGGAVLRGVKVGKDIGTKKQYQITTGQFIMSKIDARNGAFGIVDDSINGAIVTGDFPVFDVDKEKLNPAYLQLLSCTKPFIRFAQSCSQGTTNRQRINVDQFLDLQIPLPTLEEQNVIVVAYYSLLTDANNIDAEAENTEIELKEWLMDYLGISTNKETINNNRLHFVKYRNLSKWSIDDILKVEKYSFDNSKYDVIKIGDVITSFEGGKTPSTKRADYWGKDIYWVSAKDMKETYLINIQDKLTLKGVEESKLMVYPKGTLLGVFRSGILRHSFPVCITAHPVTINQDLKAFGIDVEKIKRLYFLFYLNTLQDIVLNIAMKKGVTVESINADAFMEIPFVFPPMIVQSEIVRYIYYKKKGIYEQRERAKSMRLQAIKEFETKIFE